MRLIKMETTNTLPPPTYSYKTPSDSDVSDGCLMESGVCLVESGVCLMVSGGCLMESGVCLVESGGCLVDV